MLLFARRDRGDFRGARAPGLLRKAAVQNGHFDYDQPIEGLRVLDRYTFQFKLGVPQPRFMDRRYIDLDESRRPHAAR